MISATETEFRTTLARIEAKLDILIQHSVGQTLQPQGSSLSSDIVYMSQFTTKQHAILQMLCRDAPTDEIAARLGVAAETIKTHVVIIRRKLGASRKAAVVTSYSPVFARISESDYLEASGGMSKNWDREYNDEDPINERIKKG